MMREFFYFYFLFSHFPFLPSNTNPSTPSVPFLLLQIFPDYLLVSLLCFALLRSTPFLLVNNFTSHLPTLSPFPTFSFLPPRLSACRCSLAISHHCSQFLLCHLLRRTPCDPQPEFARSPPPPPPQLPLIRAFAASELLSRSSSPALPRRDQSSSLSSGLNTDVFYLIETSPLSHLILKRLHRVYPSFGEHRVSVKCEAGQSLLVRP
ncbi:uncharacterized protein BO72DRAFT_144182 [Aspergillus fijiensis CBS 313.89]|uniref:Uncharacterized protein n=1 Tax=Aspergillus fijiensis CBS 313.89 TaxID=1448319 RepID=A0A8G1VYF3_9EURO|nr:uncharacterized protein BO72DRAFT_144182 [Aspergillus fijiensis CBS 313.89]RAK76246.1 hypothetical protein BO72DRAFT_144182 [Aspergillus fijiensis CBS 313.89]